MIAGKTSHTRHKPKLVQGIGINDVNYPVQTYESVNGVNRRVWICPVYRIWVNMLKRCYGSNGTDYYSSYHGCTVTPEWHVFSQFRAWVMQQDYEGKELDKDILFHDNKIYSPQTCVFVSSRLNCFLIDHGAARGELPIGVCWNKGHGKFQAQCSNPFTGKRGNIGYFDCPDEAHEAWRIRKHELACIYADQQTDPRIAKALRMRFQKFS